MFLSTWRSFDITEIIRHRVVSGYCVRISTLLRDTNHYPNRHWLPFNDTIRCTFNWNLNIYIFIMKFNWELCYRIGQIFPRLQWVNVCWGGWRALMRHPCHAGPLPFVISSCLQPCRHNLLETRRNRRIYLLLLITNIKHSRNSTVYFLPNIHIWKLKAHPNFTGNCSGPMQYSMPIVYQAD